MSHHCSPKNHRSPLGFPPNTQCSPRRKRGHVFLKNQLIKFLEGNGQSKAGLGCGGQNTAQEAQVKSDRLWLSESGVPPLPVRPVGQARHAQNKLGSKLTFEEQEPTRPVCMFYVST